MPGYAGKLHWGVEVPGLCCTDVAVHEFSHFRPSDALAHAAAGEWVSACVGLSCLPGLTCNNLFHLFCSPCQLWLHFLQFKIPKDHWFTSYDLQYTERKYDSLTTLGPRHFLKVSSVRNKDQFNWCNVLEGWLLTWLAASQVLILVICLCNTHSCSSCSPQGSQVFCYTLYFC